MKHFSKVDIGYFCFGLLIVSLVFVQGCTQNENISPEIEFTPSTPPIIMPSPSATLSQKLTISPILSKVAMVIKDDNGIHILDDHLQTISTFRTDTDYNFLSSNKCHILSLNIGDGGYEVISRDYSGKEVNRILAKTIEKDFFQSYRFSVSPDLKWIIYAKISGDYGMGPESDSFQQVKLLKVDREGPQKAIELSVLGGAYPSEPTWSPDNNFLVFTDFDSKRVPQLFLYDLNNGKKTQISHFEGTGQEQLITNVKWSPDSEHIAFTIVDISRYTPNEYSFENGRIGIFNIPNNEIQWLDFNNSLVLSESIWWGNNNQILLLISRTDDKYFNQVYWFDASSGKMIRTLKASQIGGDELIGDIIPFSENLEIVDFVNFSSTRIRYNTNDQSIERIEFPDTKGEYRLILSPSAYLSPVDCWK